MFRAMITPSDFPIQYMGPASKPVAPPGPRLAVSPAMTPAVCVLATAVGDDKSSAALQPRTCRCSPCPMSMTSPRICLARTWCEYSAAVSPACWQCGDYTVSTPPFALPGRRALSSPDSQPDRSAGTLAAQKTRSDLNSNLSPTARLRALRQRRPLRIRVTTPATVAHSDQ